MNTQEILSKKWSNLFNRATQIKIEYVKEQCPICKNKDLKHFSECNHIEMDLDEINKRVDKELKKETQKVMKEHLTNFC